MEAFEKVDVLKKLVEIFQKLNQGEDISGKLSLLRQQCDKFITEGKLRRAASANFPNCSSPRVKLKDLGLVSLLSKNF